MGEEFNQVFWLKCNITLCYFYIYALCESIYLIGKPNPIYSFYPKIYFSINSSPEPHIHPLWNQSLMLWQYLDFSYKNKINICMKKLLNQSLILQKLTIIHFYFYYIFYFIDCPFYILFPSSFPYSQCMNRHFNISWS